MVLCVAAQGGVFVQNAGGVADGADQRHVVAAGTAYADEVTAQFGAGVGVILQDGGEVARVVICARGEVGIAGTKARAAVNAVAVGDECACGAVHARRHAVAVIGAALAAQGADGVM